MPRDTLSEAGDEALLVLYANGDPMAARALVARLLPPLLRYATRVLGDGAEAEDVVQEVLLRLWRIAPDWRPGGAQPRTWAYRVAGNLCTDRLRARRHHVPGGLAEAPEAPDPAPGVLARMAEGDRMAALDAALLALPERQRMAVVLRHIEGLPNPEIAEILGAGVEAAESLVARGKRALQAMLGGRKADLGYEGEER